ncbi:MAG: HigA family addiction module antitoxin [Candidatus Aadella gelida]|nr:HigA family addiction module antitoxin [Candidatus Aadella gelida]
MGDRYKPDIAIHPGVTLRETSEAVNMTQKELAARTGLAAKTINEIMQGGNPITFETAIKFGSVFGTSPDFWNNLQRSYGEAVLRLKEEERLQEEEVYLKDFKCYYDLVKNKYLEQTRNPREKIKLLLNFFRVSSLSRVEYVQGIAFRKAKKNVSPQSLAAWLRCGEIEAEKTETLAFDREKLKENIDGLRRLTRESPGEYSEKIKDICASFGVTVVYVPYFKNTYVNGATRFLPKGRALIQLCDRGGREDSLWFTFFHELGHLYKHGKTKRFVDFDQAMAKYMKNEEEEEADEFARNNLIPRGMFGAFYRKGDFSDEAIKLFAEEVGMSPGIVAGRLAYETENWGRWSHLRRTIKIS